jgi:hypothetical protein
MAGLFQSETPTPNYVPLNQQSQGLLNDMVSNATSPTQSWADRANQGVSNASQLGIQSAPAESMQANTGVDPSMHQALRNAYQGQANKQIGDIMNKNSFNSQIAKANYSSSINQALQGQAQTHVNNYQQLTDAYNQSESARAQFVSAISGLANYGMGTYAAKMTPKAINQPSADQFAAVNNNPMMFGGGGSSSQSQFNAPMGFNTQADPSQMY